jgi:RNA polymerase sigma-70 factor (ECF subfamily)
LTDDAPKDAVGDLLILTAGGDHDALAALYAQTSHDVFRTVKGLLRSAEHTEEVTQEVYLQIWLSAAAAFNPTRGSGRGFIIALARRRAIDRIRTVERARHRDTTWHDDSDGHWDFSDVTVDRVHLQTALRSLGEQAQTILAVYYHGLSYNEVAEQLGVTVNAVKSRHHRALMALRGLIQA